MKTITTGRLPIKLWCNNPEDGCIKQAMNLANLPFAFKHIALMPDCHQGYGMPIGGVLATKDYIIPNAVGVDIGCGMTAAQTTLKASQQSKEKLKTIMGKIRELVPLGFTRNTERCISALMPELNESHPVVEREYENARKQMGTLGGGNHFIELQKDKNDNLWVMVHTGSRNLGKKVADHYNTIAKDHLVRSFSKIEPEWDLAFLQVQSQQGKYYIREMQYCMDFAERNRSQILQKILSCLTAGNTRKPYEIAHNYATQENHYGENVWIHRKGAILARKGHYGIIPGSQGTKSYITRGLGEPLSFMSCSHGAGRAMGRKEAMRRLNIDEETKMMNDKGIIHDIRSMEDLDEAPSAYKNIDTVMEEQQNLVEIIEELTPIAVIKG